MKASIQDPQARAIAAITELFGELEPGAVHDVLQYLNIRYGKAGAGRFGNAIKIAQNGGSHASQLAEYETVGEAFADICPKSGPEKALAVAAYLQAKKGLVDFTAQEVSSELKHLGHPATNITDALQALINQRPQPVIMLRKGGTSKQARKKYKVSEEGLRKVIQMIADAKRQAADGIA